MLFIETPIFTKQASGGLFKDDELKQLQAELLENPNKGDLIAGSGGLRKIRLARKERRLSSDLLSKHTRSHILAVGLSEK